MWNNSTSFQQEVYGIVMDLKIMTVFVRNINLEVGDNPGEAEE